MKRKQDSLLDNLYLASPCSVSWESMTGDESKRSCNGCSKTVFNISDMTRPEAKTFLLANGTTECMKFYRRTDGTIMTDDCPRALRKLRDQCKIAAKVAVGLVAFIVSFPSAFAQSIQTGDATPIQNNINKISAPNLVPPIAYPGGAMVIRQQPEPVTDPPTTIKPTPTTLNTRARIITKERTLPNGTKILLVTPDEEGKVIRVTKSQKDKSKIDTNPLMDKRASESFSKAQCAKDAKNFALAEFYLEKTLQMIDKQKTSDAGFRAKVASELQSLQTRNSNGSELKK